MRPTECAKHKAMREKIAADVESFSPENPTRHTAVIGRDRQLTIGRDRVTDDYRATKSQAARRLKRGKSAGGEQ